MSDAAVGDGGDGWSRDIAGLLRWATDALRAAGVPSPDHDARALLEHASGLDRSRLLTLPGTFCPEEPTAATFRAYVGRRVVREPLQHITGVAPFRHLELAVGAGVFVPRPETELLVDVVLRFLAARPADSAAPRVVDLCTGSGAVALAVATEVPGSLVHAVELDPAAHAWAARNVAAVAALAGGSAGPPVDLRLGDMASAFSDLDGTVDVVVANPPYIPVDAVIRDPEVASHDPGVALWSGTDGLDAMRVVEQVATRLLRPRGLVAAEHADLQGTSAPLVFTTTGRWTDVTDHQDLARRDRYVTAVRASGGRRG